MLKYSCQYLMIHRGELLRFILIGVTTFSLYIASFHFTYGILHLGYRTAATIAYIITIITHFLLNRTFTFKSNGKVIKNFWKYALMLGLNYLCLLTIMWFVVDVVKHSPYVGIVVSTAMTAGMNFFFMKYIVFGNVPVTASDN